MSQLTKQSSSTGLAGRITYPPLIALFRWVKAFWLLVAVIGAGATVFAEPIAMSIASTPHPALVYTIFGVAAVAVILFALAMNHYTRAHAWFARYVAQGAPETSALLAERSEHDAVATVFRVLEKTRTFPLAVRQPALEQEIHATEGELFARLSLPNLLSGSLVGLGLVGTFIGLLQTLSELSGVFAALGSSGSGDASSMFSTMIVRLQGPMQGMGTAFVASLYGLLGSLVIGLVGGGVRRAAERLMNDVRQFVTEDLMAHRGSATTAISAEPSSSTTPALAYAGSPMAELVQVVKQEHILLRDLLTDLGTQFEAKIDRLAGLSANLNVHLVDNSMEMRRQIESAAAHFEHVREVEEKLLETVGNASGSLADRMDGLRNDLSIASTKGIAMFGRGALALAVAGALAGLAAVAGWFLTVSSADTRKTEPTETTKAARSPNAKGNDVVATPTVRAPSRTDARAAQTQEVTVVSGDTLDAIARGRGLKLSDLMAANPEISDPRKLLPGASVRLPEGAPTRSPEPR